VIAAKLNAASILTKQAKAKWNLTDVESIVEQAALAAGVAQAQLDRSVSSERSLSLASVAKVAAAPGFVLVSRR
jgi:hypothetical protein